VLGAILLLLLGLGASRHFAFWTVPGLLVRLLVGGCSGVLLLGMAVSFSWPRLVKFACLVVGVGLLWQLLGPPKDELTADFLPHKVPASADYYTESLTSDTEGKVALSTHEYKADGIVEVKTYTYGFTRNGAIEKDPGTAMRPLTHATFQRRISGGFVEIGSQPAHGGEIQWEPVLKLGAKKGESWEDTSPPGTTRRYTVLGFSDYTIKVTGAVRRSVVVRQEVLVDGKPTEAIESTYVQGVGEQQRVSYDLRNGTPKLRSRVTVWDEAHVPTGKGTRDFFG
jgi:hypothetical protein